MFDAQKDERTPLAAGTNGGEAGFRPLFERSPDPAWLLEGNRFVECNQAAVEILGYRNREEVLNCHPAELSPERQPDGEPSFTKAERMIALAREQGVHRFDWQHLKADGSPLWAEVTLSEIRFQDQSVLYCTWRDITDRKQAERALAESEQRYRDLVENVRDWIWELDREGRFTYASPSVTRLLGYAPDELRGRRRSDLMPLDEGRRLDAVLADMVRQGSSFGALETVSLHRDGHRVSLESSATPIFDAEGRFTGCRGIDRDISERKRLERREQLRVGIVEKLALGASLAQVLDELVLSIEAELPGGAIGSIMTLDVNGQHLLPAAAPNLPSFFVEAMQDGLRIGSGVGSCGAAAFDRERVVVEDISQHPNWAVAVALAAQAGLCACWSEPIMDRAGKVLGTFACYYREPRSAGEEDLATLSAYADLAAMAIERVHDQRKLAQNDTWRRPLIEQSRDGIVFLDESGAVTDANPSFARMLGYSPAEMLSLYVWDWDATMSREAVQAGMQNISEHGDHFESVLKRKDGSRFHVDITSTAILVEERKRVMAVVRDISDRIRAEQALAEHKAKLEQLVAERTATVRQQARIIDQSHDSIVTTDLDGVITSWNSGAAKLFGLSEELALGQPLSILFPPSERALFEREVMAALKRRGQNEADLRMWRADRQPFDVHLSLGLICDESGVAVGIVGYSMDITERKRMENALRDSEANLAQAQSIAHVGSWQLDLADERMSWSDESYRIFDREIGSIVSYRQFVEHIHADDRDRVLSDWQQALQGKPFQVEHRIATGGAEKWVRQMAELRFDPQGRALSAIGIVQDITELRRAEQATRKALDEARKLAQLRSQFVANMSHEIRTPLNAIIGLARIGERGQSPREAGETFGRISTASQHLLRVVNDILDFSKIEAGKLQIDNRPFNLSVSLENVVFLLRDEACGRGLRLDLQVQAGLPAWFNGDVLRLEQVLLNFLSNAVKFTERGGVSVRVARQDGLLKLEVADTGVGMTESQLDQLFRPFEQADASTTRRFGGTGLGLAISRNLAEAMGGRIEVTSALGVGSTFTLWLPLEEASDPGAPEPTTPVERGPGLEGIRVLAAEDVELNRLVIEDMLLEQGATVQFAENGVELLALLDEHGLDAFDVVLMDIQMPLMDGYEATRQIVRRTSSLPVIGLTAHTLPEDRQRCLDAGMRDHVPKPVEDAVLVAAILRQLPGRTSSPAPGAATSSDPRRS